MSRRIMKYVCRRFTETSIRGFVTFRAISVTPNPSYPYVPIHTSFVVCPGHQPSHADSVWYNRGDILGECTVGYTRIHHTPMYQFHETGYRFLGHQIHHTTMYQLARAMFKVTRVNITQQLRASLLSRQFWYLEDNYSAAASFTPNSSILVLG